MARKESASARKSRKRPRLRDLPPKKGQSVKGGDLASSTLASSVLKKRDDAGNAVIQKI